MCLLCIAHPSRTGGGEHGKVLDRFLVLVRIEALNEFIATLDETQLIRDSRVQDEVSAQLLQVAGESF